MNRQEYLTALEKALKSAGMNDCDDILEEYSEHFDMKLSDGFSEEEISAKLASPKEVAGQFKEIAIGDGAKDGSANGSAERILKGIGIVTLDIIMIPILITLYALVFALGAAAIASMVLAILILIRADTLPLLSPYVNMPPMPFFASLLLGISLIALAILIGVGAEYSRRYTNQSVRKYTRWHKNMLGRGPSLPPIPLNPQMAPKKRRALRLLTMISLFAFFAFAIAAMVYMMVASGSLEPWHVWGWFV